MPCLQPPPFPFTPITRLTKHAHLLHHMGQCMAPHPSSCAFCCSWGPAVPQSLYEFPEFGWERLGASRSAGAANSAWTPGEAVLGYVQAYVKHFELEQHIRWVGEGDHGSAGFERVP